MKYIKKYEDKKDTIIEQKYNIGDYVVPYNNRFYGPLHDYLENYVGRIVDFRIDDLIDMTYKYYIRINFIDDLKIHYNEYNYFKEDELRPATQQEIKEYELNNDINKYNL